MKKERESIREKTIREAYKKYAPKNITLEQFITMVEKDPEILDGMGEFSTFNSELSKHFKKLDQQNIYSKDDLRHLLKDSLNDQSIDKKAEDIARIYEEIICSDNEILMAAWTFEILNTEQKQNLAVRIINALNKYFNIEKKHFVDVEYTDKAINRIPENSFSYNVYNFVQNFISKIWPKKSKYGRYGGYYSRSKLVLSHEDFFENFISALSHEYGHFIDRIYPDLGILGSQIAYYGWVVYDCLHGHERYLANPTEVSSFKIGVAVSAHLRLVLQEQAHKKPQLYIKTILTALDKAKADFSGFELKYNKAIQEYVDLQLKIIDKRYPNFYLLSEEEQNKIYEKIKQDLRLKFADWKVNLITNKRYWEKYYPVIHYEQLLEKFKAEQEIKDFFGTTNQEKKTR